MAVGRYLFLYRIQLAIPHTEPYQTMCFFIKKAGDHAYRFFECLMTSFDNIVSSKLCTAFFCIGSALLGSCQIGKALPINIVYCNTLMHPKP